MSFILIYDSLGPGLNEADPIRDLVDELEDLADEIRDYAQATAPWNDRTGAAREGLDTSVTVEGSVGVLSLFHTVDYGRWLEELHSGRDAVIMPTLEVYAHRVMAATGAVQVGGETLD